MRSRTALKIFVTMVALAVAFGVVHDLFSAAVCNEYFTDHHPTLIESRHWFAMALLWGVVATWWVGAAGGAWLAVCTQVGTAEPIPFDRTLRAAVKGALLVLVLAPVTWLAVYWTGKRVISAPDFSGTTTELDVRLFASGTMHAQSYFLAACVFLAIGIGFVIKRYRR